MASKAWKSKIENSKEPIWVSLSHACQLYGVSRSTGFNWAKTEQLKTFQVRQGKRTVLFVEVQSFATRCYGLLTICENCRKTWWVQNTISYKKFCSCACEKNYNYRKKRPYRELYLERFLSDIKADTFGKTIKVVRQRRHLAKATFCESTGINWATLMLIEKGIIAPPTDKHTLKAILSWLCINEYYELWDRLCNLARADAERIPTPQMIVKATIQRLSKKEYLAISDKPFAYEAYGSSYEEARYNLQKIIQRYVDRLLEVGKKIPTMEKGYTKLEVFVDSRQSPIN